MKASEIKKGDTLTDKWNRSGLVIAKGKKSITIKFEYSKMKIEYVHPDIPLSDLELTKSPN